MRSIWLDYDWLKDIWPFCIQNTDTSREPREGEENGKGYNFASREEVEADIRAGKYLEHGDYEGNLYGTKVDSIREVMRSGKMCILDVNPTVRVSKLFFRMSYIEIT